MFSHRSQYKGQIPLQGLAVLITPVSSHHSPINSLSLSHTGLQGFAICFLPQSLSIADYIIFAITYSRPLPCKRILLLPTAGYSSMSTVLRFVHPCPFGFECGFDLYFSGHSGPFLWILRLLKAHCHQKECKQT